MSIFRLPDQTVVWFPNGAYSALTPDDKHLLCGFNEDGSGCSSRWQWDRHRDDPRLWYCRYYGVLPKRNGPAVVDDFGDLVFL